MYSIDYRPHDESDYMKRDKYIYHKPSLKFVGNVASDTEFNQNFLPIDYKQPAYFGGDKLKKEDLYKS